MAAQQIITVKAQDSNDYQSCGCGSTERAFIVEMDSEYGEFTGYPSILMCQFCLSNYRAEAEWFSHH